MDWDNCKWWNDGHTYVCCTMKAWSLTYLTEILQAKNFARTGIQTNDFQPSHSSSKPHLPYRLRPLLACTIWPELEARTMGDLAAAAIATVSVTINQTQSLYIQWSSHASSWLTSSCKRSRVLTSLIISAGRWHSCEAWRVRRQNHHQHPRGGGEAGAPRVRVHLRGHQRGASGERPQREDHECQV